MIIKKLIAIAVYNVDEKPIAICLKDEKSRNNIIYQVEEMEFDDIGEFLLKVAKNEGEEKV